jgi:hypothetical protein
MKILIIQEAGRHPENANYRECLSLQRAFISLGVDAQVWGLNYPGDFDDKADVIFVVENYDRSGWVPDLSQSKAFKIFWSIDPHCALQRHLSFHDKNNFDIVLCSIASMAGRFGSVGRYMPNAYDDTLLKKLDTPKVYDIGFCGSMGNRDGWVRALQHYVGMHPDIFMIGDAMVKAINSYKIHWNKNHSIDLNYRTFETMGCGTFLITDNTDRLLELFKRNVHLAVYESLQDCIMQIKYYLHNDKEREAMAKAGYDEVRKNHTYKNRAEWILNLIKERI